MNATATPTAVDYVRGLPPQDKQAVFLALIREIIQVNGEKGLIPVDDEHGLPFGYYVPAEAAAAMADRELPKLSPEQLVALIDSMFKRNVTFTPNHLVFLGHDEMLAKEKGRQDLRKIIDMLKERGYIFEFISHYPR